MYIYHNCLECGYIGEVKTIDKKVTCPQCKVENDVWFEGEEPPINHREVQRMNNKLAVRINPSSESVKTELQKHADISFYEPKLMDDFLYIETTKSVEFIKSIDGVINVREQYKYRLSI